MKQAFWLMSLGAVSLLTACNQNGSSNSQTAMLSDVPTASAVNDIVPATTTHGGKARLLAAAEPFETLTESAFDPNRAKLEAAVAKAEAVAPRIKPLLPPEAQADFGKQIAALTSAHLNNQRVELAQASIEAYRVLVTQGAGASRVPAAVSLLDYAGFRYSADLKADPIRWADMVSATEFAKQQWLVVKPDVADAATVNKFQAAIDNMAASATIKYQKRAVNSVNVELDLVDSLEQYFNNR